MGAVPWRVLQLVLLIATAATIAASAEREMGSDNAPAGNHSCTDAEKRAEKKYGFLPSTNIYVYGKEKGLKLAREMKTRGLGVRSEACGADEGHACASLSHAFAANVPRFCTASKDRNWGSENMISLVPTYPEKITQLVLLARRPSCDVLVGSSSFSVVNSRQIRFRFGLDNDTDECAHAGLVFSDIHHDDVDESDREKGRADPGRQPSTPSPSSASSPASPPDADLVIRGSTDITFDRVALHAGRHGRPAMSVDTSVRVALERMHFVSDNTQHALVVLNSIDVFLEGTTFSGRPPPIPGAGPSASYQAGQAENTTSETATATTSATPPLSSSSNSNSTRLPGGQSHAAGGTRGGGRSERAAPRPSCTGTAHAACNAGERTRSSGGGDGGGGKAALWIGYDNSFLLKNQAAWHRRVMFHHLSAKVNSTLTRQCWEQRMHSYTKGRSSVTLLDVTFEDLLSVPRAMANSSGADRRHGKKQLSASDLPPLGVGAEVHFGVGVHEGFVLFKGCHFRRIVNGRGVLHASPVLVEYSSRPQAQSVLPRRPEYFAKRRRTEPTEAKAKTTTTAALEDGSQKNETSTDQSHCTKNSVQLVDCSMEQNAGYLGGAVRVLFAGGRAQTVYNTLLLRNITFADNRAELEGGAVFVHMTTILQTGNAIVMENLTFERNAAGQPESPSPGGAILLMAGSRADKYPNLTHTMGYSSVDEETDKPGQCDPLQRNFRPAELQNATYSFTLTDCTFSGNSGQGTVFSRLALVWFRGKTRFEGNTGSALVAMNSNITVTGTLVMVNNTAKQGAAIHEGEFATVRLGQVVRIKIRDNRAEDRGGAFYIDSDSSTQSTDERLMYLGQNREHAECPLQFPENLSENDKLVLFDSNKVRSLAQSGFFVGSWQKCYGVLRVTDNPAVAHNETVLIDHQAFCTPFDLFYGLANPCRVGKWTRRVTYKPVPPDTGDDWDEVAPATGAASPAASATFTTATSSPSSPSPEQRQQRQLRFLPAFCADFTGLVHRWLRMISQSASRSANSSTGRPVVRDIPPGGTATPLAKFLDPAQNPICKSVVTGWTVVNKVDLYKSKFSTQAAWIFFNKATTSCFKHIGERVWYFRDACSRVAILSHARKMSLGTDTLGLRSTTDMSLVNLALKHYRYRASAPPVLPGPELTMTPWADALHRSYQQTAHLELEVDMDQEAIAQYLHSYSDLTLNPAPGEVFDLDLTVTDELVNLRSATLSVKVESNGSNVLLGQGSRQYSPDESVLFSTGQSNWALSLLGVPGSKGVLIVTVEGDYNQRPSADEKLVLAIPFLLRRCHLGFYPPHYTDPTEASHYVRNFTECRKTGCDSTTVTAQNTMPNADRAASAGVATTTASTTAIAGVLDSSLTCRCPGAQGAARLKGVEGCERGRQINIRRDFWAGVGRRGVTEAWRRERVSEYGRAAFDALQSDPYGRDDAGFNIAPCENGLCSEHNLTRTWPVGDANPCNPAFKRVGPLCGSCEPGTYVLPSSEGCVPCHHKLPGGIPAYVVLVILLTTLVFVVLIIFDIGVTPTLDSWLFFIQAVFCLYPDNLQVGAIFYNMLTYGFGQLCVSEDLDRIGAKTLLLVQPLLLFTLLLIFQLMGKFAAGIQVIEKVFRLHSNMAAVPRVLWLCILYSSSALAYVTLTLITCVRLDTNNGNETMVLFMDGSVECFQGTHRSYAAVAILILVIFIVPPQVFLTVAPFMSTRLSEAFLLHFYHKACDMYSDTCKWWAAVSLLRRLAFAVLLTVVTDGAGRRLAMTVVSLLLLGAHATYRPFAKTSERKLGRWDVDNNFESFVLLDLSLLCVLRLVISDFSFDEPRSFAKVAFVPLFCAPTVLALVLFLIRQVPKWRARLQARKTRSPGHDAALGHAPGAEMEDSVEEDPLMHYNASQRQASRTVKEESKRAAAVNDCKYPIRIPLLMWSEES